jgi:acyl-CoA thioesterase YciA
MIHLPTEPHLALKALMMPRDTNQHGTIFGGVVLSYIDQAGAIGAHAALVLAGGREKPLVSVAMDRVEFLKPVHVGDVVSFVTRVVRVGRTSITVEVVVEAVRDGTPAELTRALVTYVAVEITTAGQTPVALHE